MKTRISALMDGELFEDEADVLLDELKQEPNLQRDWMVYHLIGDVLRQPEYVHRDISARIAEELGNEPIIYVPRTRALKQKARVFALSAAASVLAVGVVVWMSAQVEGQPNAAQLAKQNSPVRAASWQIPAKANDYLVAHQENSSRVGFGGTGGNDVQNEVCR